MNIWSASLLGFIQGVTEFLPVSSSGHLVIGQQMLGWKGPNLFFDVCLHLGTFLAVVVVFRRDIVGLVRGALLLAQRIGKPRRSRPLETEESILLLVVAGSIPTAIIGLLARHYVERLFGSLDAVAVNLVITGCILWITRYARPAVFLQTHTTRWSQAVAVGLAQSLALAPGISRSGTTIAAGLLLGLDREWAGRFSFLLFVPAVAGATFLESLHMSKLTVAWGPTLAGMAIAAITGYIALKYLLHLVKRGRFYIFAPYCWILGLACFIAARTLS